MNGEFGAGFPVIRGDDPGVYTDVLDRAAALLGGTTERAS